MFAQRVRQDTPKLLVKTFSRESNQGVELYGLAKC